MPPKPRVVLDRRDDPALNVELSRRADPPAGVVVVRPVPGVTTPAELAVDLLIGLGKRFDALTREKKRRHAWQLAQLWLQAEGTRHVVIVDADRLPAALWSALAALNRTTPAQVWLVASAAPTPAQGAAVRHRVTFTTARMLRALPVPPAPTPEHTEIEGPIPADDFLTFRASCRDLLPGRRFEAVDRIYRTTNDNSFAAVHRHPMTELLRGEVIVGHLAELAAASGGPTETVVRFRAAQAAFFTRGVLVNLIPKVLGRDVIHTVGLTAPVATRLRRLVSPELVAAFAISAAHHQLDPSRLVVDSVSPDGATIATTRSLPIPAYGHALIRVHLLERLRGGAGPHDPLFVNGRGLPPHSATVRNWIATAGDLASVADHVVNPRWHAAGIRGWSVDITEACPKASDPDELSFNFGPR